jgi:hypothetical protein
VGVGVDVDVDILLFLWLDVNGGLVVCWGLELVGMLWVLGLLVDGAGFYAY